MKTIGVVTAGRSDYGIYLPILRRIKASSDLRLKMIVTGTHLSEKYGMTVRRIEADGFDIEARVELMPAHDSAEGIAAAMGEGMKRFAALYARRKPDILLVLGDRFEMHVAVSAAVPFLIPVAHIHGGEITEGAMDDLFRHSITQMSHLHFVATEEYRRRVIQMGEEPWRVTVSGAPGLDNLREMRLLELKEISAQIGLPLDRPPLLITYHAVTREPGDTPHQISELLSALSAVDSPMIFTYPNSDTGSTAIIESIRQFVDGRAHCRFLQNLGTSLYFSVMKHAAAMVGNSSSGIIEAASFRLPVVDIGSRQRGRTCGANVIHAEPDRQSIEAAIRRALSRKFRDGLRDLRNPYGDGLAAERIVEVLLQPTPTRTLICKKFMNLPAS